MGWKDEAHEHIHWQERDPGKAGRFRQAAAGRRNYLHAARQGRELGAQKFHLAAGIRPRVLRDRNDVHGGVAF